MPNRKQKVVFRDTDGDAVNFRSLIEFVKNAQRDLKEAGDNDAALRFEIFHEYLLNDFKGGYLKYTSKALGL